MSQHFILANEGLVRLLMFVIVIISIALLELIQPRVKNETHISARCLKNIGLMLINTVAIRLLIPLAAFELAVFSAENQIGLLNHVAIPMVLNVLITLVVFDFVIYLQHVLFHKVEWLWKIHRVHHTDMKLDVTTGVRFHPFEMLLSMCLKLGVVLLIGPLAISVLIYEIALNTASLFTHSNIKLHPTLDFYLRKIVVTPDMHRIHHSVIKEETDSNYGNIFSCWDKCFHTYQSRPAAGYEQMRIGLSEFNNEKNLSLVALLGLPIKPR